MNSNHDRNPVLLIHGLFVNSTVFRRISAYLTNLGWQVYSLNLTPNYGNVGLDELAGRVADYADRTFGLEQKFDLVGLSMGGLVSRYYVQRLGGINRVQRFIAISAPHNGTWMAYSLWGKGCVQMRPKSAFIEDLNRDISMLEQINFTSIWTDWDFIIVPATSSQIPVGKELKLPIFAHGNMVRHSKSLEAVAEALAAPIKPHPQPGHIRYDQKSPQFRGNI
ncbi:alpha/beta fold hydrolase [Kamptonema animale CS-326]|jgi:triacylglycerol lipase|uniref:esterase/lipase family protein n=1 Tax=Kamptonema animale TaxID=92934 RepID=UPI00232B94BF|nr:alpha/beta fold hydrolase [Kamptonema animale]MDB9511156.1 alpha/beta fold hydrolase [Kamptonema animale CS-326]